MRFLTAIFSLLGLLAPVLVSAFFDAQGTVYTDAVGYLSDKKIVQGYPDGSVRPTQQLNRAEALKIVLSLDQVYLDKVHWYRTHMPPLALFSDVEQRQWYAPYLETAFEAGIAKGYPDGRFRPERSLSTEEAVVLVMRASGLARPADAALLSPYIGNTDSQWYTPAINEAIRRNLIMNRGRLELGTPISRGQFFDIVYRLLRLRETGDSSFPEPQSTQVQVPSTQPVAVRPQARLTPGNANVIYQPQPFGTVISAGQPNTSQGSNAMNHPYGSEQYFAISMPTLGVKDLTITHPIDPFSSQGVLAPLQSGVGHLFSYPGDGGKIMIYGHSSGYAWDVSEYTRIFRRVNELKEGDPIYVTYAGEVYEYEVTFEQAIDAKDTTPFSENGAGEELILYTCWPPDSIAQRYLIHASPVQSVASR